MTRSHPVLELEVGQFSDPGLHRENNEDWIGTFQHENPEVLARKGSLFLVADGMGGHRSGDEASRRAVNQVIRSYMQDPDVRVDASLGRAIRKASASLYAYAASVGAEGRARWGTTIVAAVVRQDELWIANVGDSRAYLQRHGKLRQLSEDHSWAADWGGEPSGEWVGSHLITRALGLKPDVKVYVNHFRTLRQGDQVLLCSDGLTTPVSDPEINAIMLRHPPQQAAEALVAAANQKGGPDNISVIVVRVLGQGAEVDEPTFPSTLERLTRPDAWLDWAKDLQDLVPVEDERLRRALLILAVLLIAVAVMGLGWALATILNSGPSPIQ